MGKDESMQKEAMLYEKLEDKDVRCFLCNHNCKIKPSKFGICGMRENVEGVLYTHAYGQVIAANIDPIEKKPLYHFLPGTSSFSIATAGCNFRCGFCQNWQISQASRKKNKDLPGFELSPEQVVARAIDHGCKSISFTYTEPTIFFEYALDIARHSREKGLLNVFVTNGFMTLKTLDIIRPYLDACNVDLKSFSDEFYKKICKGRLAPVLESIKYMRKIGLWVEVTTLVIPGSNDSENELRNIAEFIAGVDPDIPWHISRFHPDFQFLNTKPTPVETMKKAMMLGQNAGLRYIYLGNIAGDNDTVCPKCKKVLIARRGYSVGTPHLKNGVCTYCNADISGVWM
ncbi:MAG: AmmeMemoRadiSam system radical SAM enzyme [Desulfobacterales bacterium]